ncbi:metallophosphoesterase [Salinicola endophyticus]|nr:metallophosphoesterase [Salinicola endophyticus]
MRHSRFVMRLRFWLVLLHVYIGWRLLPDLDLALPGAALAWGYLALSALTLPWVLRVSWLNGRWFAWPISLMTGAFSFLLVLTLARDLLLLVLLLMPLAFGAWREASAWGVVVATLGLSLYALWQARRVPRVVEVRVPLAGLPSALVDFRIVQLSDLHVGPTIKRRQLARYVARANALGPDLVAITGDLTDGRVDELAPELEPLRGLAARHGVFCVTGNHEYYSEAAAWTRAFEQLGLKVLVNAATLITHEGAQLAVAGITDLTAGHYLEAHRSDPQRAAAGLPEAVPRVLLAHQPNSAPAAARAGFDLQLSGHTHGGQLWPWSLAARRANRFLAGLGREGRMWVYTSRGTGYWGPPMRFGAPAEITLIRLQRAD